MDTQEFRIQNGEKMAMNPNEKTLELNFVRNYFPKMNIVWQGTTLREEFHKGWDCGIGVDGAIIFFQVKRPYVDKYGYHFGINNNSNRTQHQILYDLAHSTGVSSVFYVLPCVDDTRQLAQPAPLKRYAFVDINQANFGRIDMRRTHDITINLSTGGSMPPFAMLHSQGKYQIEIKQLTDIEPLSNEELGVNLEKLKMALHKMEKTEENRQLRIKAAIVQDKK